MSVFEENRPFFRRSELAEAGLSQYRINKLVQQGVLAKRSNKLYENLNFIGEITEFAVVTAYAPTGVLCLLTAARYHGLAPPLASPLPSPEIQVALERGKAVSRLPEWPTLQFWYFPTERFCADVMTDSDACGKFQIYGLEKTVTDILHYRTRVGLQMTINIMTEYLARSDRDLPRLLQCARAHGDEEILHRYLEVLL